MVELDLGLKLLLGLELKSNYGRVRFRATIRGRGRVIIEQYKD